MRIEGDKASISGANRDYLEANRIWVDQALRAKVIDRFCMSGKGAGYSYDYAKVRVSQVLNRHEDVDTIFQLFLEEIEKKKEEFISTYQNNKKIDDKIIQKIMTISKVNFENGKVEINGLISFDRKELLKHRSRIAQSEHPIPTSGSKKFYDLHPDVQAEIKKFISDAIDPQPELMFQKMA